jgi:hypothetical protein
MDPVEFALGGKPIIVTAVLIDPAEALRLDRSTVPSPVMVVRRVSQMVRTGAGNQGRLPKALQR